MTYEKPSEDRRSWSLI